MSLFLHEINNPDPHDDLTLTAVADTSGRILNNQFAPDEHDLGIRFYLTATGANSQAQTTFTDSRTVTGATLNGGASVTVASGDPITAVVNVTTDSGGGNQNWRSTGWRISTTAPPTTAPPSVTCVNHNNHDGSGDYSESFTITAPSGAGIYNAYFIAY